MSTQNEMMQELEALRAENTKLKKASARSISLKVSAKGAVSVYGLGRFPVTLYKGQWDKLLVSVPTIEQFIKDNKSKLAVKAETAVKE